MIKLILITFLVCSQFAHASDPFWTCYDGGVRYEVDWNEVELNFNDIAYVYTQNQKITGEVIGMSMWSPDIVFFDPNRNLNVVLLLDTSGRGGQYSLHEYKNNSIGKLLTSKVRCRENF